METAAAECQQKLTYAEIVKGMEAYNNEYGVKKEKYLGASNRAQTIKPKVSEQGRWRWKPKQQHQVVRNGV